MTIELNINKKIFNDAYFPYIYDYSKRHNVYFGSAGSGKSVFVFQKMVIKALREKRKILVVRKVGATNFNSTFTNVIDILKQFQIYSYCNVNQSTLRITLLNGSQFLFVGCDDSEKLKSIANITDIIVEEATELTLDDVTQLDLRLRAKVNDLQIYYMFNPISKANWVYQKWFDRDSIINDDTFILKTTYKDNKFLPDSYKETLEKMITTNPTYYRIYALGEFCSLDKLVYSNWKIEDFDYREKKGELICGLDFGFSTDKSAFVASILDETNRTIYVFKNWTSLGKTNDELAKAIINLGFGKSTIIADSAEPKSIEELKRAGLYRIKASIKGPDSIIHGIQKLQQYHIIIHPECEEIITEFQNYSWQKDKKSGEYINKPIDAFNHSADALRYSIQCVGNKLHTVSKAILGL